MAINTLAAAPTARARPLQHQHQLQHQLLQRTVARTWSSSSSSTGSATATTSPTSPPPPPSLAGTVDRHRHREGRRGYATVPRGTAATAVAAAARGGGGGGGPGGYAYGSGGLGWDRVRDRARVRHGGVPLLHVLHRSFGVHDGNSKGWGEDKKEFHEAGNEGEEETGTHDPSQFASSYDSPEKQLKVGQV